MSDIESHAILPPTGARAAWWHVRPIFLFTALGAVLRLTLIGQPSIWGDEALTYGRVTGSYRDMLDILQRDGFVPLHYELYWVLSRFLQLTPPVLRMVPTIAGILMVPAMYFLARQIVVRRTANLVALFTACSAYMLAYSRDAKMYAHFWLWCVLTVGCFLWWLRSKRRLAWLAWIASGVAMAGLHMPGTILLGLMPLMLLTFRRVHWKDGLLVAIGLGVIAAGPAGYYYKFNHLIQRSDEQNFEEASGTFWVEPYNRGRTGPDHVLYTATAFLFSWEWPRQDDQKGVDPATLFWLEMAAAVLLGAIALGVLPWPAKLREGPSGPARFAMRRWRNCLWLGAWIVVPAYGFYCRSVRGFYSPGDWIAVAGEIIGHHWIGMVLCAAASASVMLILFPRGKLCWSAALLIGIVLVANLLLPWNCGPVPRLAAAAVVIGSAGSFYLAEQSLRQRMMDLLLLCGVAAVVLLLCEAVYRVSDPNVTGSIWMPRYVAIVWPAFAIVVCSLILRLPTRAFRWGVIGLLLTVNLVQFASRVAANVNVDSAGHWLVTGAEPPVDQMAQDIVGSDAPRTEHIGSRTVTWRPQSTTRVYCVVQHVPPGPGSGTVISPSGRYYLEILGQTFSTPREFRGLSSPGSGFSYGFERTTDAGFIAKDVAAHPQLQRIIVWDAPTDDGPSRPDPLMARLGAGWDMNSVETFAILDHWRWLRMGTSRRREYVRRTVATLSH